MSRQDTKIFDERKGSMSHPVILSKLSEVAAHKNFKFKQGDPVAVPRPGSDGEASRGIVVEGIITEAGIFYEIVSQDDSNLYFSASEDDLIPLPAEERS